jgi:hypothetical protein
MKNAHITYSFERLVDDVLSSSTQLDEKRRQLTVTHSQGFFSNCSVTLWALTKIYPSERFVGVNWPSQDNYRDSDQAGENLFNLYFEPNTNADTRKLSHLPPVNHHGIYADMPFEHLNPYIQSYFAPSDIVRKKQNELIEKYKIDYEKTVGLVYRGTDKWTEVGTIPPRFYIMEAERLVAKHPDLRILVQTDQEQVRNQCASYFGEHAFYIDEMPVTSSLTGLHTMSQESRKISNFEFGVTLLAVFNLIANCRYVVSHTGNVGLWVYLYRGKAEGMCQLRPRPPDRISDLSDDISRVEKRRNNPYTSILEEKIGELRSESFQFRTANIRLRSDSSEMRDENIRLLSDLNDIRSSVMYRCMRFLASRIDVLFPDGTTRGAIRKHITHRLRAHLPI